MGRQGYTGRSLPVCRGHPCSARTTRMTDRSVRSVWKIPRTPPAAEPQHWHGSQRVTHDTKGTQTNSYGLIYRADIPNQHVHFGRLGLCVAHASRSFSDKPPARIDEIHSPCPYEDGGDATPRGRKAISGVALDDGDHRRFSERCSKGSPALCPGASSNSAMCVWGAPDTLS